MTPDVYIHVITHEFLYLIDSFFLKFIFQNSDIYPADSLDFLKLFYVLKELLFGVWVRKT